MQNLKVGSLCWRITLRTKKSEPQLYFSVTESPARSWVSIEDGDIIVFDSDSQKLLWQTVGREHCLNRKSVPFLLLQKSAAFSYTFHCQRRGSVLYFMFLNERLKKMMHVSFSHPMGWNSVDCAVSSGCHSGHNRDLHLDIYVASCSSIPMLENGCRNVTYKMPCQLCSTYGIWKRTHNSAEKAQGPL